ncbi:RNA methyltransferase [Candidatus Woesearchaeota archaeon CG08_land_8_20_14_0_20_47_9]|nr:MAG: RNA methyltransferase [Candidatus Woesearchaeota archaeon CG08_land_8_20_14_0_20_47_9]
MSRTLDSYNVLSSLQTGECRAGVRLMALREGESFIFMERGCDMISILLIEPETPGNIGAVARVMRNFGFSRLIIVNPKCDHLSKEALDRASHGREVLKKARIADLAVLKEFDYAVATTAKLGTDYNLPRSPVMPWELAERLAQISDNVSIALVFGRESSGLTNREIRQCDFVVTIPSARGYRSLNISHAVAIILYEVFRSRGNYSMFTPISSHEKEVINKNFSIIINKLQFATPQKRNTQLKLWKRVIGKAMLTRREAFAVLGLLKKVRRVVEKK